jgi:hypothetical protein
LGARYSRGDSRAGIDLAGTRDTPPSIRQSQDTGGITVRRRPPLTRTFYEHPKLWLSQLSAPGLDIVPDLADPVGDLVRREVPIQQRKQDLKAKHARFWSNRLRRAARRL